MKKKPDEYLRHQTPDARFDVYCLPAGVSPFSAQPGQLVMVTTQALNSFEAQHDPTVQALVASGFVVAELLPSGRPSALASAIRARAARAEQDVDDPVPNDMRGPNNRAASGLPRL